MSDHKPTSAPRSTYERLRQLCADLEAHARWLDQKRVEHRAMSLTYETERNAVLTILQSALPPEPEQEEPDA